MARMRGCLYGGLAAVVVAALPVVVGFGGSAEAATGQEIAVPAGSGAVMTPVGGAGTATTTRSTNAAGYFTPPIAGLSSLVTSVTVPTATCTTQNSGTEASAQMGGSGASGSLGAGSFLFLSCFNDAPAYGATVFVSTSTSGKSLAVSPGDKLTTRVVFSVASGVTTARVRLADVTTKAAVTMSGKLAGTLSAASAQDLVAYEGEPLTDFGILHWSNVQVGGATLASTSPNRWVLVSATGKGGHLLVGTSLVNKSGKGFANRFVAAS